MQLNSLNAMGTVTFMCPYRIEKSMYFILVPDIKSPYKFSFTKISEHEVRIATRNFEKCNYY